MNRKILGIGAVLMLIAAGCWIRYSSAPVQSVFDVMTFEIVEGGPPFPNSPWTVKPAVGFAAMYAFGLVICLVGLAKTADSELNALGRGMFATVGGVTLIAAGASFWAISNVYSTFMVMAQSANTPSADQLKVVVESSGNLLRFAAMGCIVAALFALLACLKGSRPLESTGKKRRPNALQVCAAAGACLFALLISIAVYQSAIGSSRIDALFSGSVQLRPVELASNLVSIIKGSRLLYAFQACIGIATVLSAFARSGHPKSDPQANPGEESESS